MSASPSPADRQWVVPLADVLVDDELLEAARRTLASGWWSMGPRVERFESEFAAFTGSQHAIAVANGTAALHIALLAVGCGPGDEVVLPSLNFVAAANTVVHTGATPVFCDIRGDRDLNLDPDDLEAALTPRTRAVVVLHYGGHPCEIERVVDLCRARGIAVIEDAAHAVGTLRGAAQCGSFGDVGCFSFFSNKNLPVGEGGMVVTNDASLAERTRLLRSHGMTTLTWDRHRGHASAYDVVRPASTTGSTSCGRPSAASSSHACRSATPHERSTCAGIDRSCRTSKGSSCRSPTTTRASLIISRWSSLPSERRETAFARELAEARHPDERALPADSRVHGVSPTPTGERELPQTEAVRDRILTLPLYPHMTSSDVDLVSEELVLEAIQGGIPKRRD